MSLSPNDEVSLFWRGDLHSEMENHDLAIKDYSKVIKINPLYNNVYFHRGSSYVEFGDIPKALEDFSSAISLYKYSEDRKIFYLSRALIYDYLEETEKALEDVNHCLRIDSSLEQAIQLKNKLLGR